MSSLCFVTSCMGRLAHLRQTLPRLTGQANASCVVVDYSCPDRCGNWAAAIFTGVRVVRVTGETYFNLSRARNVGAAAADASWLCFVDADVLVAPNFIAAVLPQLRPGNYYRVPPPAGPLAGTTICARADFERVGGFDEVLQGWGGEDLDFYNRLDFIGVTAADLPSALLEAIPHKNALRVQQYRQKDLMLNWSINRAYATVILDLVRLGRRLVPLAERQAIYGQIAQVLTSPAAQAEAVFAIDLGRVALPNGRHLERALTYRF